MAPLPPAPLEFRTCYSCGRETTALLVICPRCGRPLATARSIRARGWLLAACGIFLLGLMGYVTFQVADTVFFPGRSSPGSRYTGTREMLYVIFGIFALVLAFGAASLWTGVYQIFTGRRSRGMVVVIVGIAVVLAAGAVALPWLE